MYHKHNDKADVETLLITLLGKMGLDVKLNHFYQFYHVYEFTNIIVTNFAHKKTVTISALRVARPGEASRFFSICHI